MSGPDIIFEGNFAQILCFGIKKNFLNDISPKSVFFELQNFHFEGKFYRKKLFLNLQIHQLVI